MRNEELNSKKLELDDREEGMDKREKELSAREVEAEAKEIKVAKEKEHLTAEAGRIANLMTTAREADLSAKERERLIKIEERKLDEKIKILKQLREG